MVGFHLLLWRVCSGDGGLRIEVSPATRSIVTSLRQLSIALQHKPARVHASLMRASSASPRVLLPAAVIASRQACEARCMRRADLAFFGLPFDLRRAACAPMPGCVGLPVILRSIDSRASYQEF